MSTMVMICYGLQSSIITLVGQHIGAGNVEEAKSYHRLTSRSAFVIVCAFVLAMWLFKNRLISLFLDENNKSLDEARSLTNFIYVIFVPGKLFEFWQIV